MKRTYALFLMVLCLTTLCFNQAIATAKPHLLKRAILHKPTHFDPNLETTVMHLIEIQLLFEGLVRTNRSGQLIPGAAKRWEVSDDGRTYRFYLREGLKWSDGTPLTIDQFMASFKRIHSLDTEDLPSFIYTPILNSQDIFTRKKPVDSLGIKIIDKHTLEFQLSHPAPYFPELMLVGSFPLPTHIMKDNPKHWARQFPLVSNGPYQVSQKTSHSYHYQKNPHYRKAANIYYTDVRTYTYNSPNKALMDMARGKLDVLEGYQGGVTNSDHILAQTNLTLLQQPNRTTQYITFNLQDKHLKKYDVRQAIILAINRESIAEKLTLEKGHETYTFAPTGAPWGWDMDKPDWFRWSLSKRIKQAQALMRKQGYTPIRRLKLEFLVNNNAAAVKMATQIKSQLAHIWIDLKVIKNEASTHYLLLDKGQYQLARAGWGADFLSPSNFYNQLTSNATFNHGEWHNDEYDRLNQLVYNQPLTPQQREEAYQQMELLIRSHAVICPINMSPFYTVFSNKINSERLQQRSYESLVPFLRPAVP